jgi:hypothetical protein
MRNAENANFVNTVASVSAVLVSACANVPGETLAPQGLHGDIRDRIYSHARATDPQCRQQKIANTEILELHPAGQVAEERWVLENCGRKFLYIVSYPRGATGGARFQVSPER